MWRVFSVVLSTCFNVVLRVTNRNSIQQNLQFFRNDAYFKTLFFSNYQGRNIVVSVRTVSKFVYVYEVLAVRMRQSANLFSSFLRVSKVASRLSYGKRQTFRAAKLRDNKQTVLNADFFHDIAALSNINSRLCDVR